MAIVQISRIQVRRGRENTDTGLPQLASGEMAWAIDTQQLYIGNGSVSEGAPAVGNTKLLTSADLVGEKNILNIADYTYKKNIALPTRSVQQRLDERVNFYSFNDLRSSQNKSTSDNIQTAINFLYTNDVVERAVLEFSPGIYELDAPITVPSHTSIKGSGIGRTIFKFKSNLETPSVSVFNLIDNDDINQECKNVTLSDFTLMVETENLDLTGSAAMTLSNVKNSQFRDLEIIGYWENDIPDPGGIVYQKTNSIAVKMQLFCENNQFDNVMISFFRTGIYALADTVKSNIIKNSKFYNNQVSIDFGQRNVPADQGPSYNIITNCTFNRIQKQGIKIYSGKGNVSSQNNFTLVGDNFGNSSNAQYGVIEFDVPTNLVMNSQSDRHSDLANGILNRPYISEIVGKANYTNPFTNVLSLNYTVIPKQFLRLPVAQTCHLEVEYLYKSNNQNRLRRGKLSILVDLMSFDAFNNPKLELVDDYDYLGLGLETSYTMEDVHLIFTASSQTFFGSKYVVNIFYQYDSVNTFSQGDQAIFTYTYKILS
jgi:hypothetical protein